MFWSPPFFGWGGKLKHINFVSRIWFCQLCFDRLPWATLGLELKRDKSFRASFHCSFQLWAHNDNPEKLAPIDRHDQRVFACLKTVWVINYIPSIILLFWFSGQFISMIIVYNLDSHIFKINIHGYFIISFAWIVTILPEGSAHYRRKNTWSDTQSGKISNNLHVNNNFRLQVAK